MIRWEFDPDREKFNCPCGRGHYPIWASIPSTDSENFIHQCCQQKCCVATSFPGRAPTTGDVALCGRGCLGIITSPSRKTINYPHGSTGQVWVGYHLTNACAPIGGEWASRSPCILFNLNTLPRIEAGWHSVIDTMAREYAVKNWNQKQARTQITMASSKLIDDIVKSVLERSWLAR